MDYTSIVSSQSQYKSVGKKRTFKDRQRMSKKNNFAVLAIE